MKLWGTLGFIGFLVLILSMLANIVMIIGEMDGFIIVGLVFGVGQILVITWMTGSLLNRESFKAPGMVFGGYIVYVVGIVTVISGMVLFFLALKEAEEGGLSGLFGALRKLFAALLLISGGALVYHLGILFVWLRQPGGVRIGAMIQVFKHVQLLAIITLLIQDVVGVGIFGISVLVYLVLDLTGNGIYASGAWGSRSGFALASVSPASATSRTAMATASVAPVAATQPEPTAPRSVPPGTPRCSTCGSWGVVSPEHRAHYCPNCSTWLPAA